MERNTWKDPQKRKKKWIICPRNTSLKNTIHIFQHYSLLHPFHLFLSIYFLTHKGKGNDKKELLLLVFFLFATGATNHHFCKKFTRMKLKNMEKKEWRKREIYPSRDDPHGWKSFPQCSIWSECFYCYTCWW